MRLRHPIAGLFRIRRANAPLYLTYLCLIGVLLAGCSDTETPGAARGRGAVARAAPVIAVPVVEEQLRDELKAVGTARALKSVALFPEAAGVVVAVNFTADQYVNEGDVLLALDARDEELSLQLARVQRDDAALVVKRFASVNLGSANIPESELDSAKAALAAAEIAVQQAEVALARRQIRATFSGRVGITDIDVGDRVDTATQVTTLDDRSVLLVDFPVPETFVGQVATGTSVSVHLWEDTSDGVSGEVVAVDSRIDPASRAFTARAGVDNGADALRPGMAFEIGVAVNRGDFLAVPDVAVQWGADGAYVWTAEDGKARRVGVEVVRRLSDKLLIEAELDTGQDVIAEGVQALREGVALRILDADALDRGERIELASPTRKPEPGAPTGG